MAPEESSTAIRTRGDTRLNRSIIAGNIGSLSEQSEYLDLAELKADQLGDVSLIANVKSNKAYNSLEKGHYRQAEWLAQECLS